MDTATDTCALTQALIRRAAAEDELAAAVAEVRRLQQELIRAKAALHAWEARSGSRPTTAPGDVQLRDRFTVGQLIVTLHGAPFAKAGA